MISDISSYLFISCFLDLLDGLLSSSVRYLDLATRSRGSPAAIQLVIQIQCRRTTRKWLPLTPKAYAYVSMLGALPV